MAIFPEGRGSFERLWRVVLLTIALRHTDFSAWLAELHRNPSLCHLIDITTEQQIPDGWNLSRFLDGSFPDGRFLELPLRLQHVRVPTQRNRRNDFPLKNAAAALSTVLRRLLHEADAVFTGSPGAARPRPFCGAGSSWCPGSPAPERFGRVTRRR
jgi:hypothetical protein